MAKKKVPGPTSPDENTIYKFDSTPYKGHVLILNYTFKDIKEKTRDGWQVDVFALTDFFTEHNFKITLHLDKTKEEIINQDTGILAQFIGSFPPIKNSPGQMDASFIVIMSHGKENGQIEVLNGEFIDLHKDIVDKFSYNNAERLQGIPKVFITQACRGHRLDGVLTNSSIRVVEMQTDSSTGIETEEIYSQFDDMLIIFPTLEGYAAPRNPKTGSQFIQNCIKIFKKYGKQYHLIDMLIDVHTSFTSFSPEVTEKDKDGNIVKMIKKAVHTLEYYNRGFKRFYFCPPLPNQNQRQQNGSFAMNLNYNNNGNESVINMDAEAESQPGPSSAINRIIEETTTLNSHVTLSEWSNYRVMYKKEISANKGKTKPCKFLLNCDDGSEIDAVCLSGYRRGVFQTLKIGSCFKIKRSLIASRNTQFKTFSTCEQLKEIKLENSGSFVEIPDDDSISKNLVYNFTNFQDISQFNNVDKQIDVIGKVVDVCELDKKEAPYKIEISNSSGSNITICLWKPNKKAIKTQNKGQIFAFKGISSKLNEKYNNYNSNEYTIVKKITCKDQIPARFAEMYENLV